MRKSLLILIVLCAAAFAGTAFAQEHWTEGPVWSCSGYRTVPGKADDYLKYLRENFVATTAEAKAQGLILDSKVFTKMPANAEDWDVMICNLHPSYGKALDYNPDADAKMKAIQAKHYKTTDEKQQDALTAKRFEMRTYLWTRTFREVNLRPIQ